jgi:hypothetical protein
MNNKLNEIKRTTEKWNNPMTLKRRDEIILNQLRIGHAHYIHGHLMEKEPQRICQTCGYPTSIKHIITERRDT